MLRVLYIYRHSDMGYSIGRVFKPIEEEMKKYAEVDSIYLPIPNYSLRGLWKNIRAARKAVRQKHYGIVHITGAEHYLIPFLHGQKVVVTVHDIMYYFYLRGLKKRIWKFLFVNTLNKANYVTFISQFSKDQVLSVTKNLQNDSCVIHNAVDKLFQSYPKVFDVDCPTILHIGTLERKNLARTIEAISDIKCKLRIIGKQSTEILKKLKEHNIDYSIAYGLSDEEILDEYKKCDIVNFVSLFEGFGMPILEGQATGRVVITSNISPMNEVAGDGAVLVNPLDVDDIKSAYQQIIKNPVLRSQIINNGKENIIKFQLYDIVQKYLRIYRQIL